MGCLSNYAENKIIDHTLNVATYTRPTTLYLALCTANPGETATGSTLSEPSGGAYSRKAINSWAAPSGRSTSNSSQVDFDEATGDWGNMTHWAICDASTGGNVIAYGEITEAKTVNSGDSISVAIGDCIITMSAGGMSTYLVHEILDHLFVGNAFSPPTVKVALCTSAPSDDDAASDLVEPSDTYERVSFSDWSSASGGTSSNNTAITFPRAASGYGTVTHMAITDAGNGVLYTHALTQEKTIGQNDNVSFSSGTLTVSID